MVVLAKTVNVELDQGATWSMPQQTHKNVAGTVVDLTGYTAVLTVRRTPQGSDKLMELTTASSEITLGGAAGTIDAEAPTAKTTLLKGGDYVYDLQLTDGAGKVTTALRGRMHVRAAVTT